MTTKDELIEICKEFVESGGESIDKLFDAIMDWPLKDIHVHAAGNHPLLVKKVDDLAALDVNTGVS